MRGEKKEKKVKEKIKKIFVLFYFVLQSMKYYII